MGAIHKMAVTLGDSPTVRALRGNFSSQRSLPHLAKHFFLPLSGKKSLIPMKIFPAQRPLLVTMLILLSQGLR